LSLRHIVFAFSHVCIAVILLRFATDPILIANNDKFFEREDHKNTFIEWVRRDDFPSLELFARIKEFSEDRKTNISRLALSGLNEEIITNTKRPRL
jgi:hypothetical protein